MRSGIERRIDDLGRIVIPKELCQQVGINYGDLCDVSIGEHGTIVIQKQTNIQDVSGEIDRIKNAVLDNEVAAGICEEVFKHLNRIDELIKTVKE